MELIDRDDHQKLYLQLYEFWERRSRAANGYRFSDSYRRRLCKLFNVAGQRSEPLCLNLVRPGLPEAAAGKSTFIFRNMISKAWPCWPPQRNSFWRRTSTFSTKSCRTVMMPVDDMISGSIWERQAHYLYKENALHWKTSRYYSRTYIPTI